MRDKGSREYFRAQHEKEIADLEAEIEKCDARLDRWRKVLGSAVFAHSNRPGFLEKFVHAYASDELEDLEQSRATFVDLLADSKKALGEFPG